MIRKMTSPDPYVMKSMRVLVNMDRLMGKHFESGLHNPRTIAERP